MTSKLSDCGWMICSRTISVQVDLGSWEKNSLLGGIHCSGMQATGEHGLDQGSSFGHGLGAGHGEGVGHGAQGWQVVEEKGLKVVTQGRVRFMIRSRYWIWTRGLFVVNLSNLSTSLAGTHFSVEFGSARDIRSQIGFAACSHPWIVVPESWINQSFNLTVCWCKFRTT